MKRRARAAPVRPAGYAHVDNAIHLHMTCFSPRILLAFVIMIPATAQAKRHVVVPEVSWEDLVPYIRSHVVPYLQGDDFHVYVCEEQVLQDTVQPYDEALGDFAKVLLYESLRTDSAINAALADTTAAFRGRLRTMATEERRQYRDLYWEDLASAESFLPRVQHLFNSAVNKGRLRCWLCEKDSSYRPTGLQQR